MFIQKVQQSNEQFEKKTKLVVCMEELAELFQVLSKHYRNKPERLHLIEELGDQLICVESIRQFYDITEVELTQAFQCAKQFVSEQRAQEVDTHTKLLRYMKEVIEIAHIFSKCCTEDMYKSQMLSTLCSLLVCVDGLYQLYGIAEEELNRDINVKIKETTNT